MMVFQNVENLNSCMDLVEAPAVAIFVVVDDKMVEEVMVEGVIAIVVEIEMIPIEIEIAESLFLGSNDGDDYYYCYSIDD